MTQHDIDMAVRRSVTVGTTQQRCFQVFTGRMGTWWPLDSHSIGAKAPETTVIEGHVGGRWFERDSEGHEYDWGRVLAWEPPERVVLAWQLDADWKHDPSVVSEVEVRFIAEGPDVTRVELEHRGLGVFGDRAVEMRETFDSAGGWALMLDRFTASAPESPAT